MKFYSKILLSLFLSIFITAIFAAEPSNVKTYKIEMIIFSHITARGLDSEHWPLLPAPSLELDNAYKLQAKLEAPADTPQDSNIYELLPSYDLRFNEAAANLIQAPGYAVLLHVAWEQQITNPRKAKWIHIYGGQGFDDAGNVVAEDSDGSVAYDQAAHWQVDGMVRVDVKRYLNTRYQLYFAAPMVNIQNLSDTDNFADIDSPLTYFELKQSRRMRSNELNYIGHPLYGVLIDIQRV